MNTIVLQYKGKPFTIRISHEHFASVLFLVIFQKAGSNTIAMNFLEDHHDLYGRVHMLSLPIAVAINGLPLYKRSKSWRKQHRYFNYSSNNSNAASDTLLKVALLKISASKSDTIALSRCRF